MALVSKGWVIAITLTDQGGNRSVLRYDINPASLGAGTEHADAVAILNALLLDLNLVTQSSITQHSVSEVFVEDTDFYGAGENENIALVISKVDALGKTVNIRIPNPEEGLFKAVEGPDYNELDPADVALQGYLANFTVDLFTSDGENILDPTVAGNFYGKRIHRGSRKG